MVKIAHASIDENGKISGGQAGDQTGKEVCIRSWYNKPWNVVIRFNLPAMRQKLADFMRKVANNPYVGYDQQNRNSLLQYARNVGYDPSKINTPCEGDCSSTVTVGCIYAGLQEKQLVINGNCATTRTLRNLLKNTGMVDIYMEKDYTAKADNLLVGDILLSEGHHVAVVVEVERSGMKTSQKGIDLIKQFEGCRLNAYKAVPTEKCYTIGYGHYGSDVAPNMTITQAQADAYLAQDLERNEKSVNTTGLKLNQNQFDALVSFTYNCGAGNLKKLVTGRDLDQIADAILFYNKAGGQVLAGLIRRRQAEHDLFVSSGKKAGNPYPEPKKIIRLKSSGNDVKWLQYELNKQGFNLTIDGIAGPKTISALTEYQIHHDLVPDGICGTLTRAALKTL